MLCPSIEVAPIIQLVATPLADWCMLESKVPAHLKQETVMSKTAQLAQAFSSVAAALYGFQVNFRPELPVQYDHSFHPIR